MGQRHVSVLDRVVCARQLHTLLSTTRCVIQCSLQRACDVVLRAMVLRAGCHAQKGIYVIKYLNNIYEIYMYRFIQYYVDRHCAYQYSIYLQNDVLARR